MTPHDARAGSDAAVERIRDVAQEPDPRDQADELQTWLEHASEEALREFGRAAIRAQRTPEGWLRRRRRSRRSPGRWLLARWWNRRD